MHNLTIIFQSIKEMNKYKKNENIKLDIKINNLDLFRH